MRAKRRTRDSVLAKTGLAPNASPKLPSTKAVPTDVEVSPHATLVFESWNLDDCERDSTSVRTARRFEFSLTGAVEANHRLGERPPYCTRFEHDPGRRRYQQWPKLESQMPGPSWSPTEPRDILIDPDKAQ
jgi:hypothetical protein